MAISQKEANKRYWDGLRATNARQDALASFDRIHPNINKVIRDRFIERWDALEGDPMRFDHARIQAIVS